MLIGGFFLSGLDALGEDDYVDCINVSNFNRISAEPVQGRIAVLQRYKAANPTIAASVSDNVVSWFGPDTGIKPRFAANRQRGLHDLGVDDNGVPSFRHGLAASVELQLGFLAVSHPAVGSSVCIHREGWKLTGGGRFAHFVDEFFQRVLGYVKESSECGPHLFAWNAASLPCAVRLLQDAEFRSAFSLIKTASFLLVDDELREARFLFRHKEGDRQILTNL